MNNDAPHVTVEGKRYLVGIANGQWLVLDLDTGKQELCHNARTAVYLASEWNAREVQA